jgi:hypothetical protein
MSRPGGPYRDERYPPQQQQYPQDGYQSGYPQRGYPDQGYGPDYGPGYNQGSRQGQGYDQGYAPEPAYDPGHDSGYDRGYGGGHEEQAYRPQHSAPERPRPSAPPPPEPEYEGGGFRLPGLGLLFSLLGLVVQVLCLVVLPWASGPAGSAGLPEIWDVSAGGFGGSYVLLFSYPLAALGILLSLVAVLESVVMKVIWAVLALIGVGALALKFGWGSITAGSFDFSRQEITYGVIALSVLVVVIFMLKMAMSTFRIVGGLVLLAVAGVHVAALRDMTGNLSDLEIGAYGPAVGYVLAALAAFIGPRRLT